MSSKQSGPNLGRIAVVTVAGGGLMFAAAQILAKPKEVTVVRAVTRPGTQAPTGTAASYETAPVVSVRDGLPAPQPLALAGDPAIRNLFTPLVKPPSDKGSIFGDEKPKPPAPPPVVTTPPPPTKVDNPKPPVVDAASTVEMMGVVELDDKLQVLLKNRTSGERMYVSKGEEAFGYKVGEIKENSVELIKAGGGPGSVEAKPETVAMSSMVIVEGAATPAAATVPGVGTPGAPGAPGAPGSGGRNGGDRGGRGGRGGNSGSDGGGFSTSAIFSLPTWTERLKKLDEMKAQMPADRYERLRKFMADRAAAEKK